MYFKTMGSVLKLKPGIVPHKFLDRPPDAPLPNVLSNSGKKRKMDNLENIRQASTKIPKFDKQPESVCDIIQPSTSKHHVVRQVFSDEPKPSTPLKEKTTAVAISPSGAFKIDECNFITPSTIPSRSVGVQVNIKAKTVRSIRTNTQKIVKFDSATSPIITAEGLSQKYRTKTKTDKGSPMSTTSTQTAGSRDYSSSEFVPSTSSSSEELSEVTFGLLKETRQKTTLQVIEQHPRFYLGLSSDVFNIVKLICRKQNISYISVLISLKKIRVDDSYFRLSQDFGLSVSQIQRIFVDSVPKIANALQNLIFWPDATTIKKLLPLPFRARYQNVQSIIDCFEVEIEKPSDPVFQACTWSEYKHCNTVKFLISSTPNGFINFISQAYAGRISDKDIVIKSKYLEKLPNSAHILADRGFKHVSALIEQKGNVLVRPPSVSTSQKSSAEEVKLSKRIASLRIHIERVIRRVREFAFLKPHSCVNHNLIYLLDSIVIIVCALVNLQEPII